jgi:hypothetical protein
MERTVLSENKRKDSLFEAWIEYLDKTHFELYGQRVIELFEGMASVSELSKTRMTLRLEDGRRIRKIPITPKIATYLFPGDSIYLALGRRELQWRVMDVISIGSLISGSESGEFHFSINPEYISKSELSGK